MESCISVLPHNIIAAFSEITCHMPSICKPCAYVDYYSKVIYNLHYSSTICFSHVLFRFLCFMFIMRLVLYFILVVSVPDLSIMSILDLYLCKNGSCSHSICTNNTSKVGIKYSLKAQ